MAEVDLAGVARRVAGAARPGEQVEAYVLRSRDVDVKVFGGDVESLAAAEVAGVGVRVIVDARQGYAWAGSLDDDVVAETLAEARDNAAFGAPDDTYVLASPSDVELDGVLIPELDLWHDDVLSTPTSSKVELALQLERAARDANPLVRGVESASYGDAAIEAAVANSNGVEASTLRTIASCSTSAMAGEGTATQTGSGFSVARGFADVDPREAARDAAERAVRLLGAKPIPSGRMPVVLDPLVTRSLLGLVSGALSGEAIVKGRSLFVGREGEDVAAPGVTLVDDPTLADAFGAATHDAEGVPTRRVELIAKGRFDAVLHNVHTARRAGGGARTTGSAVRGGYASPPGVGARALHLVPGELGAEEILASVDRGLYVQSVSGLHSGTNPVSGDFSVGAVGLVVRDGALAEPVREVTIASTLQRILHDVVAIGDDLRWVGGGAAGMTLLVADMSVSGA